VTVEDLPAIVLRGRVGRPRGRRLCVIDGSGEPMSWHRRHGQPPTGLAAPPSRRVAFLTCANALHGCLARVPGDLLPP